MTSRAPNTAGHRRAARRKTPLRTPVLSPGVRDRCCAQLSMHQPRAVRRHHRYGWRHYWITRATFGAKSPFRAAMPAMPYLPTHHRTPLFHHYSAFFCIQRFCVTQPLINATRPDTCADAFSNPNPPGYGAAVLRADIVFPRTHYAGTNRTKARLTKQHLLYLFSPPPYILLLRDTPTSLLTI